MRFIRLALICLAIGLTGCASGVKYKDMSASIAPVKPDQGRVFFYRTATLGAAIQPDIKLDNSTVGSAKPEGFFYIDANPGGHIASTATEVERQLSFNVDPGETKYVRASVSLGFFVYRVIPELVSPDEALKELQEMKYTGTLATANVVGNGNTSTSSDTSTTGGASTYNADLVAKTEPRSSGIVPVVTSKTGLKLGQSSFTVEKMAKQRGCESDTGAGLISNAGPVEVYQLTCQDGSTYLARCELRQCTPMQ